MFTLEGYSSFMQAYAVFLLTERMNSVLSQQCMKERGTFSVNSENFGEAMCDMFSRHRYLLLKDTVVLSRRMQCLCLHKVLSQQSTIYERERQVFLQFGRTFGKLYVIFKE